MRNKRLLIVFGILLSLTLLIAICSAVFSVKRVDAYCFNWDDEELITKVAEEQDKLKGKSIFMIKESQIISEVEASVPGIQVIKIERLFPDRIYIQFIKIYEYYEVEYDGNYYSFGIDGRITRKSQESRGEGAIKVKMSLTEAPEVNGSIAYAKEFDALKELTLMFESLDYRGPEAPNLISSIDFTRSSRLAVYIPTRNGVDIKLLYNDNYNDVGNKLRTALSLYTHDDKYRRSGMITVSDNEQSNATYSEESDY